MARDKWHVEYTDTFGGEANYSWVRRGTVELVPLPRDTVYTSAATVAKERRAYRLELMRKAREVAGIAGLRGRWHDMGDYLEFHPYRICTRLMVTLEY